MSQPLTVYKVRDRDRETCCSFCDPFEILWLSSKSTCTGLDLWVLRFCFIKKDIN